MQKCTAEWMIKEKQEVKMA